MADKIYLKSVFGYREDTLENWQNSNPVLEKGEPSIVRDGVEGEWLKIGDGETPWNDLPWKKGPRGDDYVLTEADKQQICDMAKPEIDQSYSPKSENAQSGKAVAEALEPFNRQYELIETITIAEEGISTITRNTEPNGKAYSFKDVFVKFTWNTTQTKQYVLLEISADGKKTDAFRDLYQGTTGGTSWIRTLSCYGHRLFLFSDRTTNTGYATYATQIPIKYFDSNKPIDALKIQYQEAMPTGTEIEIWGVRA